MFFFNVKGQCHGCFFDNIWQHCEIDSCKWSDLQKSFARGPATDCRPFIGLAVKIAYLCHPLAWHIVDSGLPKLLRCAIYAEFQKQHIQLKLEKVSSCWIQWGTHPNVKN